MSINTHDFGISIQGDTTNQYLLFQVGEDNFCVKVEKVNQIEFYSSHKVVPFSPSYVLGITKTRGVITTLVHLGTRLNLHNNPPKSGESHIIYIDRGNNKILGMLVDRVTNLVYIPKNIVKEDLEMINTDIPLDFLKGAATIDDDKIVVMLNLDLVLSNFEVEDIRLKNLDSKQIIEKSFDNDDLDKYDLANSETISYSDDSLDEDDDDDLFSSVSQGNVDIIEKFPKKDKEEDETDDLFDSSTSEDDDEFLDS